jgi:hypothetical protein
MAWVVFLPLYILHVHEKHAEKHQLLYTYTYKVQLRTPKRNGYTYGYSYTYDVQLLLGGKATTTKTVAFKSTLKNTLRGLFNYLNFLFNNKNRLMLIKR